MDAFENMGDNGFEEVPEPTPEAQASAPVERAEAEKPEPEPEKPETPEKREPEKRETEKRETDIPGRSEKQRRRDALIMEQRKKLQERYDVEFANIEKKRPKPKAYNAAAVLSAPDQEAKIRQILARDRAAHNARVTRKGSYKPSAAKAPVQENRKRNAPSILSSTRSAAAQIREKARADLKALKESAERELREIGANVSVLHPIFSKASPQKASPQKASPQKAITERSPQKTVSKRASQKPKSRSITRVRSLPARLNQITSNNN